MKTVIIKWCQGISVMCFMFALLFAMSDPEPMKQFYQSKLISFLCLLMGLYSLYAGKKIKRAYKRLRFYQGSALD